MKLTPEQIARIAHEAHRAYCHALADHSIAPWDITPQWQKDSAIAGVTSVLADLDKSPEQLHHEWMESKLKAGWKFGPTKRPEALEHPDLLPWDDLAPDHRIKDELFLVVVRAVSEKRSVAVVAVMPYEPKKDDTQEVGILTSEGEVVKNAEIVTEVKKKSKKRAVREE
jgi:hypothetical protein